MSHDHSVCVRPALPSYTVSSQQAQFQLDGTFMNINQLNVWKTQLTYAGQPDSTVFAKQTSITLVGGMFVMTLEPDQIYTLTTMTSGVKGMYAQPPASQSFPLPYSDNFESYAEYSEAYNFVPQSGVWEVRQTTDPAHGKVNRQVLLTNPIFWCPTGPFTLNLGGDHKWTDVSISLDVFVPSVNGSLGVYVAGRVDGGGCYSTFTRGIYFYIFPIKNSFCLATDLNMQNVLSTGLLGLGLFFKTDTWYTMTLIIKKTLFVTTAVGRVNGIPVFATVVPDFILPSGFVAYGTPVVGLADFDNLRITAA